MPQFYINLKLHKEKLGSRPVTGGGGSILYALSKWVNKLLQPFVDHLQTYVHDWKHVVEELTTLRMLLPGAKLFTVDVTSIYTNIEKNTG